MANINIRVQQKHDIEANWIKAVNFIPLAGELIIYDIDENYSYKRLKIGDGETLINSLPFIGYATTAYVDEQIGEIETALDEIIKIQESLKLEAAEGVEFGNV